MDGTTERSKRRIATVSGGYPQYSETFVSREVRGLRERGLAVCTVGLHPPAKRDAAVEDAEVTVYGPGRNETLIAATREAIRHPVRTLNTLLTGVLDATLPGESVAWPSRLRLPLQAIAGVGLAARLRQRGVDHIHCHFAHAPTTVGMYAARQLQVPFSFTGHANDLFQRRVLLRRKLARASAVAAISHWHADFYGDIAPEASRHVHLVRCGVDSTNWRSERTPRAPGPLRLITVARLIEKKGIGDLIDALAKMKQTSTELTVIGDGPMRASWEERAQALGVGARVHWAGALPNDEVRKRLLDADAFVLPCKPDENGDRDGIPVVFMEAMAMALPVISGDLPAIRELIKHDDTGLLIEPGDAEGLARHLDALSADPQLCERLGRSGRRWVQEEFELARNITRLMAAIDGAGTDAK